MAKAFNLIDLNNQAVRDDLKEQGHTATYCPEDNKLRVTFGYRIDSDLWQTLSQHHGWTWTMKQDSDFVTTWSPQDALICRILCDNYIGDEEKSPAERSADRAERFEGYLANRRNDAHAHADAFNSQDATHGHQSQAKADRAAAKHERQRVHALDNWDKAEYWLQRTQGVVESAMYRLSPDVRARRIKKLEAAQRKHLKEYQEHDEHLAGVWRRLSGLIEKGAPPEKFNPASWTRKVLGYGSAQELTAFELLRAAAYVAINGADLWSSSRYYEAQQAIIAQLKENEISPLDAVHAWRKEYFNDSEPVPFDPSKNAWACHYVMRLAYEQSQLEAVIGKLACDLPSIERGGLWRGNVIRSATKNKTSGKYRSVSILYVTKDGSEVQLVSTKFSDTQDADDYTPPTELTQTMQADLWELRKAQQAILKASQPAAVKLLNPSLAEAEKLQALVNAHNPSETAKEVLQMTQAQYSAHSKGSYARFETREVSAGGRMVSNSYMNHYEELPSVVKIRANYRCIVHITDKPCKPLPESVWNDPIPAMKADLLTGKNWELLKGLNAKNRYSDLTDNEKEILHNACVCRLFHAYAQYFSIINEAEEKYTTELETARAEMLAK